MKITYAFQFLCNQSKKHSYKIVFAIISKEFIRCIAVLFLFLSCLAEIAAGQPSVTWTPKKLNVDIPAGGSSWAAAEIISTNNIAKMELSVVKELAPFLTVSPKTIPLKAGVAQQINLNFSISGDTPSGQIIGVIQARSTRKDGVEPVNFPITINVTKPVAPVLISGEIGPEGGAVKLDGLAEVILPELPTRPTLSLSLSMVKEPQLLALYNAETSGAGPALQDVLRIHSSENISTPVAIIFDIPNDFAYSLPSTHQVELFAEFVQRGEDGEEISTVERLGATYDAATGKAYATLPPSAFTPVASVVTNIVIGSYPQAPHSTVTGSGFSPANQIDVSPNQTLIVSGNLLFEIPPAIGSPLAGALTVTSSFGLRTDPVTGTQQSSHMGTDYAANEVSVFPVASGQVKLSGPQTPCPLWEERLSSDPNNPFNIVCKTGYGHRVTICHPSLADCQFETRYGHLEPYGLPVVGQFVSGSMEIGIADTTGKSTGPHLHLECRTDGSPYDCTNFIGGQNAAAYLAELSVITMIDGSPIPYTARQIDATNYNYNASINLTPLALSTGAHILTVGVRDALGRIHPVHSVKLQVKSFPLSAILRWNKNDTDVDLHVLDSKGNESWYANKCGVPNGCLDHDDTDGFGPEVFDLSAIDPNSTYRVFLHYYSDHGNGPTTATVTVKQGDTTFGPFTKTLSNGEYWTVGDFPR